MRSQRKQVPKQGVVISLKDRRSDTEDPGAASISISIDESLLDLLGRHQIGLEHFFILYCIHYRKSSLLEKYLKNQPHLAERILSHMLSQAYIDTIAESPGFTMASKGAVFFKSVPGAIVQPNTSEDDLFEEWWNTFPRTATWISDSGQRFISGRVLRTGSKKDNRRLYLAILREGIPHSKLMACLKAEISAKKARSVERGENVMEYFKGSLSYLTCRYFENFIDLVDAGILDAESSSWEAG